MKRKLLFVVCLSLLCLAFDALAGFYVQGPGGTWYESWYVTNDFGLSELKCVRLDHEPPIDP